MGMLFAIAVPEFGVSTPPHCRRKVTVPLVVGAHVRVVGSPVLKEYPSGGMLKGLALSAAAAARVAMALRVK